MPLRFPLKSPLFSQNGLAFRIKIFRRSLFDSSQIEIEWKTIKIDCWFSLFALLIRLIRLIIMFDSFSNQYTILMENHRKNDCLKLKWNNTWKILWSFRSIQSPNRNNGMSRKSMSHQTHSNYRSASHFNEIKWTRTITADCCAMRFSIDGTESTFESSPTVN